MATAQSTLFYGVFVKTAYLCFASDAYSRIKSSLLGIDMICSRRRKGNLSTSKGHESIKRVPEEVWSMIRYEIGGDAIFKAEQQVVGYHDSDHYSSDDEGGHCRLRTWDSRMSDSMNEAFCESDGMEGMFEGNLESIKELLKAFGLVLPLNELYSKEEYAPCDRNCLSAISLPLHTTSSPSPSPYFPFTTLKSSSDLLPVHGMTKFSKQTFSLPSNADSRFKSFLSLFRLEAMNDESETVYRSSRIKQASSASQATGSTNDKKESESTGRASHVTVCCSEPVVEPHWHMWTILNTY